MSRGAGGRRRGGEAARVPGAGAAARGEHDRIQGERRGDRSDGHRDERRARVVPRAAREPGVTPAPRVAVLAAPSGGGKTTIARELVTRHPDLFGYSVSATTRKARPGERDGAAYHFLTRDEFLRRRDAGEFLEWAPYAGELYDRVLVNDDLDTVVREVVALVQGRDVAPNPPDMADLLSAFVRQLRTEAAQLSQSTGRSR